MHLVAHSMRPKSLPAMLARPAGRAAARMSMSAGGPTMGSRVLGLVARGGASLSADALEKKKNVAFLFAADWCKPCRDFVPKLVKYYELAKRKGDDKLEILWVSASRSQEAFDAYLKEMPWPAAPFTIAGRLVQAFQQKGHAKGFPTLCFMDTNEIGSVITCDGVQKVMADEYGLTMPYRSPIQNVKRMVQAVAGVVKALLRALGVGEVSNAGYNEIVASSFSGRVIGYTTESLQEKEAADKYGRTKGQVRREVQVSEMKNDIESLKKQVNTETKKFLPKNYMKMEN